MDEVHFQQHGSRCRMWVPPEIQDPVLPHHPSRHSIGYFGAVRLRDGTFCCRREADKFNAVTCWQFLQALRAATARTARRVVVITDNAPTMLGFTGSGGSNAPSAWRWISCRLTAPH